MRNKALIFGYFWIIIALFSVYNALKYGFFHNGIPQAGFFPAIAGSVLLVLGAINVITIYKESKSQDDREKENKYRVIFIMLALFCYVALFYKVGFLILTPITIYVILRLIQYGSVYFLVAVSVIATVLLYVVFHTLLKIQFPSGSILSLLN